jgi:hypothetical protein
MAEFMGERYNFIRKTIEEHNDCYLLTYSFMRDESYALKYVVIRLNPDHTMSRITFTSPEGRVTARMEKGITGIDAWESDVQTRMYGGMTKNFPLPALAGNVEQPELAEIIIRQALDAVEDDDIKSSLQNFLEDPTQREQVDVKSIENLVFL